MNNSEHEIPSGSALRALLRFHEIAMDNDWMTEVERYSVTQQFVSLAGIDMPPLVHESDQILDKIKATMQARSADMPKMYSELDLATELRMPVAYIYMTPGISALQQDRRYSQFVAGFDADGQRSQIWVMDKDGRLEALRLMASGA